MVAKLCDRPRGLILVTGPTGSGKSTTLAAMLDKINSERHEHIITIEDPIEFVHPHKNCLVNQRELHQDTKSFTAALRAALREDPDVVLIGEMRDLETIEIALRIAETGHLTFGTLHTNSASSTINRVIDVFPAHQQPQIRAQLSLVLEGILCQALLPKAGGSGRAMAMEVLVPNPAIRNLIREDKIHQIYSSMQSGQDKYGMQTFNQSLMTLYLQKSITLETALLRSSNPDELQEMINRALSNAKSSGATAGAQITTSQASREVTMPVFTYSGNNAAGEKVQGERAAENKQVLRAALARERIQANVIKEKGAGRFNLNMKIGGSVKAKELAIFFRQFSVMIDAGLPLVQCLEILGNNQENDVFQEGPARRPHLGRGRCNPGQCHARLSQDLRRPLHQHDRGGRNRRYSRHHSAAHLAVRRKGRQDEGRHQVRPRLSGLGHCIAVLVVGALLKFVVPIFANLFVGLGVTLPASTQFVISLSNFVSHLLVAHLPQHRIAGGRHQVHPQNAAGLVLHR